MPHLALLCVAGLVAAACSTSRADASNEPDDGAIEAEADAPPSRAAPDAPSELGEDGVEADAVLPVAVEPLVTACRPEGGHRWLAVPEASGAARLDPAGDRVVIVGDSGHAGAALVLDVGPWTGVAATLAVDDGASDDLEGLARAPDGRVVGLTSAGWFREWAWDGASFMRTRDAYAGSSDQDWLCGRARGNCGKNYEGLCLHPAPAEGACVGFAASKTAGLLVCVREGAEGYRLDPSTTITVVADVSGEVEQGPLSACTFEPEPPYRLVVGGNLFTGSAIWEVVGYDDPATASIVALPVTGAPNQEALEFAFGGRLLSFGDVQDLSPESPTLELRCR